MREFIYFSQNARTSGNFKDLMKAGRIDIVCHAIIAAFFLSKSIRPDVKLHLIFNGPPDPPKHLELHSQHLDKIISKKDISGLIKRMLFKYKKGKRIEAFPGCFIEKKSLSKLIKDLQAEGKEIYILDKKGEDIRNKKFAKTKNPVFLIGDHEGLKDKKAMKRLKKISLGKPTYFAAQSIIILQNELDRRESSQ